MWKLQVWEKLIVLLDHSQASWPLDISYSSENTEESTCAQEDSQSGPSHYTSLSHYTSVATKLRLPVSLPLISALCPISYRNRRARLWHPRHVCLSKLAHALPSSVFLCCFSDWLFPMHFEWPGSMIICSRMSFWRPSMQNWLFLPWSFLTFCSHLFCSDALMYFFLLLIFN